MIERGQLIAGVPAVALRKLMRELMHCSMSSRELADRLAAIGGEASAVSALEASVYVEVAEPGDLGAFVVAEGEDPRGTTLYRTTIAGNALAKARLGKQMDREKAAQLLEELLDRVRAENDDPASLFWIESVATFGSYNDLTKDRVGDVDIHLLYRHRYDAEERRVRNQQLVDVVRAEGRAGPKSYLALLTWSDDQLFKRLRARQSRLDIQFDGAGDGHLLPPGAEPKVVYRRDAKFMLAPLRWPRPLMHASADVCGVGSTGTGGLAD